MLFIGLFLSLSTAVHAGARISHTDERDEKACHKEIIAIGCDDADRESFIACVDMKRDVLSEQCRAHHQSEKARLRADSTQQQS